MEGSHMIKFPPSIFNTNELADFEELDEKYSATYDI